MWNAQTPVCQRGDGRSLKHLTKAVYENPAQAGFFYVRSEWFAVGAACVSFAHYLVFCAATKAMWSPVSRHAVNPSMGARARRPVSHGPETGDHTPLAMCVFLQHWILEEVRGISTIGLIVSDSQLLMCTPIN